MMWFPDLLEFQKLWHYRGKCISKQLIESTVGLERIDVLKNVLIHILENYLINTTHPSVKHNQGQAVVDCKQVTLSYNSEVAYLCILMSCYFINSTFQMEWLLFN